MAKRKLSMYSDYYLGSVDLTSFNDSTKHYSGVDAVSYIFTEKHKIPMHIKRHTIKYLTKEIWWCGWNKLRMI